MSRENQNRVYNIKQYAQIMGPRRENIFDEKSMRPYVDLNK